MIAVENQREANVILLLKHDTNLSQVDNVRSERRVCVSTALSHSGTDGVGFGCNAAKSTPIGSLRNACLSERSSRSPG